MISQTNKQGIICQIKDVLSGAKLQRSKREERWNAYVNNEPINDIEKALKWHSFVIKVLKLDMLVVGQKQRILHDRRIRKDVPTIYACTHIGRYDAEQLLLAIGHQAHVFFGDPGDIYRTVNGLLLHFNGVIYVETNNKNDRIASKSAINKLMNQGGSLLIFPEGAWNITENLPVMRLYSGAVETAIKTSCDIVPIAMEEYGNTYVINIGGNISFRGRSIEDKNSLTDELRNELCKLRWEIWEDKGIVCRESLRPNEAEIYVQSIMKRTTNGYTVEKINKRKYQDNHNQY